MSVIVKRSNGVIPRECKYGCCTEAYGKNIKHIRRRAKRRERAAWKREARV